MGGILGKLFRFSLVIIFAPLVVAFTVAALAFLGESVDEWLTSWFVLGFIASAPIWIILMASGHSMLQTLEHELNHAILAKLFFRQVTRLEVTPYPVDGRGGVVEFAPGCGCLTTLIILGPYYLPLFTIPFLFVRPFASQPSVQNALNLIIGVTYAFHIVGLAFEFRSYQTDLTRTGCLFSLAVTVLFNAAILVIIVGVVMGDFRFLTDYFSGALELTQEYYQMAIAALRAVIAGRQ